MTSLDFSVNQLERRLEMKLKNSLSSILSRLNKLVTEDMSEYEPNADYDTRVKLPEWQLKKLKKRRQVRKGP